MISPRVFTGATSRRMAIFLKEREALSASMRPRGMARELARHEIKPVALVLTHGHFDHMWDAALIQEDHKCPVFVHSADAAMVLDTSYVKMFGVVPTIRAPSAVEDLAVPERGAADSSPAPGKIFACSISRAIRRVASSLSPRLGRAHQRRHAVLRRRRPLGPARRLAYGPGAGSAQAFGPAAPETRVYAGHGPSTTIGHERETIPTWIDPPLGRALLRACFERPPPTY